MSTAKETEFDDDDHEEKCSLAASGQKIVIYSILLNFLLRSVEQAHIFSGAVVGTLFFCVAAYSLLGVIKICSGLDKTQNQKVLFLVFSFFPLINVVMLVYLSVKTSRMLREAGWTVGLFGARR